jgi:hypothetical protein
VVAVGGPRGGAVGALRLDGAPRQLVAASGPGRTGRLLYCLEEVPGPDDERLDRADPAYTAGNGWRLLVLDPGALGPVGEHALPGAIASLTVTADGEHAFALSGGAAGVVRLGLASGAPDRFAALPGAAAGLAVTADRVFVALPGRDQVLVLDRCTGRPDKTIRVGRYPVAVVAGGA